MKYFPEGPHGSIMIQFVFYLRQKPINCAIYFTLISGTKLISNLFIAGDYHHNVGPSDLSGFSSPALVQHWPSQHHLIQASQLAHSR